MAETVVAVTRLHHADVNYALLAFVISSTCIEYS
jgi:hypothetical protein